MNQCSAVRNITGRVPDQSHELNHHKDDNEPIGRRSQRERNNQRQNHGDEKDDRGPNTNRIKHVFALTPRPNQKPGAHQGNQISQRIQNGKCDNVCKKEKNASHDAHKEAHAEADAESVKSLGFR